MVSSHVIGDNVDSIPRPGSSTYGERMSSCMYNSSGLSSGTPHSAATYPIAPDYGHQHSEMMGMSSTCQYYNNLQNNQSTQQARSAGTKAAKPKSRSNYKHIPHREKPPHLVQRRNARERRRVQAVNTAFVRLRRHIPHENKNKRLSKVSNSNCCRK